METVEAFLSAVLVRIANRAASGAAYPSWPDDFARSQVREAWLGKGEDWETRVTVADLCEISDERLRALGFGSWDGALTLIPIWAFKYIADGEVLTAIDGDQHTVGVDEIDLDTRFGCIASGFTKPGAIAEDDPR